MKQRLNFISFSTVIFLLLAFVMPTKLLAQRPELIIPATHIANSVVISPDDKWMASAGKDGIKIWENKTGRLLKNLTPGGKDNKRFDDGKIAMAFNNTSRYLAFQLSDTVFIFDFDQFMLVKKIRAEGYRTALVFSNKSDYLFAGGRLSFEDAGVILERINFLSGQSNLLKSFPTILSDYYKVDALSISPDDKTLMITSRWNTSWIIGTETGTILKTFPKNGDSYPVKFLSNGNILSFSGRKQKALFAEENDVKTFLPVRKSGVLLKSLYNANPVDGTDVYTSEAAKVLLYYEDYFYLLDLKDFTKSAKHFDIDLKNWSQHLKQNIALSNSGNYIVPGHNMAKMNSITFEKISSYGLLPLDSYVQFNHKNKDAVSLKDRTLVFENGNFIVQIADTAFGSDYSGALYRITEDGKRGFLCSGSMGLYSFDATATEKIYKPITKINEMGKKFVGMQIFDKLNLLALIGNEGIYVMDLQTLRLKYIVDIPYGLFYNSVERLNKFCDISSDNTKMILFAEAREDSSSYVYCVDLADRNEKWKYESVNIQNLRFVKNDKNLLFTSNGNLIILDAETGTQVGNTVTLPDEKNQTIISPAGVVAATQIPVSTVVNAGSDIGLIDIKNNKAIGIMRGTGDEVNGFVFLHNERYMLTEEYGGLCLWDVVKKRKLGKIYMFERSGDWILLTDDGRFDATEGALKKMYFTKGKEIIPLESLYEKYYVPGLLKQIWDNTLPNNVPDIADINSPPSIKITLQTAERNLDVTDDVKTVSVDKEQVTIKAEADGLKDVISEIRLYQNGKLVGTTRNLTVEDENKGDKTMTKTFSVTLNAGSNNFKAIAINSQRTESLPAELIADYKPLVIPVKTRENDIQLYLFVVGVNTYKNPKYTLNYAKADAAAFTEAITTGSAGLFGKINTTILNDADATKEGITAAFEKIKAAANPQDLFIFYYAGHGVVNDKKEFFLVPYDVTQLYGNDGALAQKGFSAAALQQMSKEIKAQKQLFILDACQSAGALEVVAGLRGAAEEKAIAQLARATGTQWLTASGSEQFASEFSQLGHGSFTWCLLEAFKGDTNPVDKKLTVKQLDAYLQTKVPEITQKYKGTPQYPASYSYGNDFPIIIIK